MITVPFCDISLPSAEGKQEWHGSYGRKCELIVESMEGRDVMERNIPSSGVNALRPTTDLILEKCPHFRILVIGRTGAGKSSLINKIFGVGPADQKAHVSHSLPGDADINIEIRSKSNPQFILHDSLGFEPGETNHFNEVRNFIQDRNKKTDIKEKLHAVWVCLKIPVMGDRVLETGIEHLLQLQKEGELGDVPIIVVFTQFDLLCDNLRMNVYSKNPNIEISDKEINQHAEKTLHNEIIAPFERNVGREVVQVTVSTHLAYERTLQGLARTTFETVYKYLSGASLATAVAQRVSPEVKIRAIIDVGRKQYWRSLATSLNFPSHTLNRCLEVIHMDIIKVWSFNDPNKLLFSREFNNMMINSVDVKVEASDSTKTLSVGLSMVATLGGILATLSGPAAPIVIPIAAVFVVAVWAREAYVISKTTLRRMMTYIFDLTMVTQNIFWIHTSKPMHPITRRLIKLAFHAHISSNQRNRVLVEIDNYCEEGHTGADTTFKKIRDLINGSMINSEEMLADKQILNLGSLWTEDDELWDTPDPSSAPA